MEISALVIVKGDDPDHNSEVLGHLEKVYEGFVSQLKFKQDRVLFFKARPDDEAVGVFPSTKM